MRRKVTASRNRASSGEVKADGRVTLTMAPEGARSYEVARELFDGSALRTLDSWKVSDPVRVLEDCVRDGEGVATC